MRNKKTNHIVLTKEEKILHATHTPSYYLFTLDFISEYKPSAITKKAVSNLIKTDPYKYFINGLDRHLSFAPLAFRAAKSLIENDECLFFFNKGLHLYDSYATMHRFSRAEIDKLSVKAANRLVREYGIERFLWLNLDKDKRFNDAFLYALKNLQ